MSTRSQAPVSGTLLALTILISLPTLAAQVTINGPAGSGAFGTAVNVLPDGKFVVLDPSFDAPGPVADVGAAYLYQPDGTLIGSVRGSTGGDQIGSAGIVILPSGNFLIRSPLWNDGATVDAGAVTFVAPGVGLSGVIGPSNSLVGGHPNDRVGESAIAVLSNGEYLVATPTWDNGSAQDAGAVTLVSELAGLVGAITSSNSLVGTHAGDQVGFAHTVLTNSNLVLISPNWDDGVQADVGAVTFVSVASSPTGEISAANSLVGSQLNDRVGSGSVLGLSNGNYVVTSPSWDNGAVVDAGAVTLGSGTVGIVGPVSASNSLVGTLANNRVGNDGVVAVGESNYVVRSRAWNDGAGNHAGAVTFCLGNTGTVGPVSMANSLVGQGDTIGSSIVVLSNGNYVVASPLYDLPGALDAGAVTLGSGLTGVTGVVSSANSLTGSHTADTVGFRVTALSNGNFVASSRFWDGSGVGAVDRGAATFVSGTAGLTGVVSDTNSLVGVTNNDWVGENVVALANGNYVVLSPGFTFQGLPNLGAATWGSGTTGVVGTPSLANSLIGQHADDQVGFDGAVALPNGNYVVKTPFWTFVNAFNAGAFTLGNGATGTVGLVNETNSTVGRRVNDLSTYAITVLPNSDYLISGHLWDNGLTEDVGVVARASGTTGLVGELSPSNALVGAQAADMIAENGVSVLSNGDYVVRSSSWDSGGTANVGAITRISGSSALIGSVGASNSIIGSTAEDRLGQSNIIALGNGKFIAHSPLWNNGAVNNAGAMTLAMSDGSVIGPITNEHSVLGAAPSGGASQVVSYDGQRNQMIVGQRASNRVVLHRTGTATILGPITDTPDPSIVDQQVTVQISVTATTAPTDGEVRFSTSMGESCVDNSPTATSATTATFSCAIVFSTAGNRTMTAEYLGSTAFAYGGLATDMHLVQLDSMFANGFE